MASWFPTTVSVSRTLPVLKSFPVACHVSARLIYIKPYHYPLLCPTAINIVCRKVRTLENSVKHRDVGALSKFCVLKTLSKRLESSAYKVTFSAFVQQLSKKFLSCLWVSSEVLGTLRTPISMRCISLKEPVSLSISR